MIFCIWCLRDIILTPDAWIKISATQIFYIKTDKIAILSGSGTYKYIT